MPAQVRGKEKRLPVRQRLGVLDHLVNIGTRQRPREFEIAGGIGGRVVAEPAAERHDPAVPLHRQHETNPLIVGRPRRDDRAHVAIEVARHTLEDPRRVAEVHMHFLDLGLAVAELVEPLRRPRSAPAGIDDEVGGHLDIRLAGLLDAHTLHDAVLDQ